MIVVDIVNHLAAIFQLLPAAYKTRPYLEVDELPEGSGILKVDAPNNRIWWEPVPEPAEPQPPTADRDYESGEYLTVDGVLYRVLLPIFAGAQITVGTNVEATTIESEIANLNREES